MIQYVTGSWLIYERDPGCGKIRQKSGHEGTGQGVVLKWRSFSAGFLCPDLVFSAREFIFSGFLSRIKTDLSVTVPFINRVTM